MSRIFINYPCKEHPKGEIREKVLKLLQKLENKYGINYEFTSNDACQLSGSGISGVVTIKQNSIAINASLGLMMMAFKSVIEEEIMNKLNEIFLMK